MSNLYINKFLYKYNYYLIYFTYRVIENIIEKEVKIELDEECLKKEVIDYEELERIKREEERLKREAEELEALKLAQAKKTIITVTDFKKDEESYF